MKLSEAEKNALCVVTAIGEFCGKERLGSLGISQGKRICVLYNGGFGVIIGAGGTVIGLSRRSAEKIYVNKIFESERTR